MNSSQIDAEARAQLLEMREDAIYLELVDGRTMTVPIVWYSRLWYGSRQERANFELLDEGRYVHWPDLDEDLTIDGMVAGRRSGESRRSLEKWLATRSEKP